MIAKHMHHINNIVFVPVIYFSIILILVLFAQLDLFEFLGLFWLILVHVAQRFTVICLVMNVVTTSLVLQDYNTWRDSAFIATIFS
jgi:fumarate reductase subunit C